MPDSNAARIHAAETGSRRPLGRRIRVPAGAIVQTFPLASGTPTSGRTAITAAAQRLNPNTNGRKVDRSVKRPENEEWQGEAWALRDEVGELRFIGDRQARACSQVRIFIGKKADPLAEPKPIEDTSGPAVDLDRQLFGNQAETEQVLKRAAQHLIYNGESLLLASEDEAGRLSFKAHSVSEVTGSAGRWKLNEGLKARDIDDDTEVLVRAWNPHPETGARADAPVRAILPVARELVALTKYVSAQVDSRLAGSGLLLLPQGIESAFSKPAPEVDDDGNVIDEDDDQTFADELTDYMIVPVQDRAAGGSVVPFMATVPPELVDKIKHISFATPLDEHAPPLREEAIRRVGLGMDSDPSVLLGQASSNHWCMDEASEVYTRRGWVGVKDIRVGDECLSLDHATGLSVWKPVVAVYRADVVDEPMLAIDGYFHSSLTTMGHRWPVERQRWDTTVTWEREWSTSSEIAYLAEHGKAPQLPVRITRGALNANLPTVAKYDDALVELVAWYFTEGTTGIRPGRRTPTVGIYQSAAVNPDNCARIRNALTTLFGPASESLDKGGRYATAATVERCQRARDMHAAGTPIRDIVAEIGVSDTQVRKYLRQDPKLRDSVPRWREIPRTGTSEGMLVFKLNAAAAEVIAAHAPGRVVPTDFIDELTHAQLLLFVDTALRADGHQHAGRTASFGQKNPTMLDAFERACLLLGYSTTRSVINVAGFTGHTMHQLSVSTHGAGYRPRSNTISVTDYTGTVWCPTVADTNSFLMRRNGRVSYTGNSAFAVDDNEVKFGVVPVISTVCHALSVGLVQPILRDAGVADADLYQVWYDETSLQVRPDRSKDAQGLYDKGVLSKEVLRRENGFSEDDKPTEIEVKDKLLRELLTSRPDWADKILTEMGIIIKGVNDPATLTPAAPPPVEPAGDAPPPAAPPLDDGTGVAPEAPDGPPVPDDGTPA